MLRTLPHLRLSVAAIVCNTFLNFSVAGIEAKDKVGEKLLPEPRIVDAPFYGGAVRLAISFDGKRFAIAGTGRRETIVGQQRVNQPGAVAYLYDADTGKQIALLELADQQNYGGWRQIDLAFSPNGKSLATLSAATVQLWDPANGREQLMLTKSDAPSRGHISFSPNGNLLAVSRGFKDLEIWDVATQKKSHTISGISQSASAFPDEESLLTAGYHNRVHLLKLADGEQIGELHAKMGILESVEISPDRKLAAVAGGGGFKLLDISSESPRLRERSLLRGHIGEGGSVSFARKQNLLATAGDEGTVRLWDPQNGILVGLLWWPEPCNNTAAALSPNGELLVVSRRLRDADGQVTEIYPVAELTQPDRITRIVLAAAESLFRETEPEQDRSRLKLRVRTSALLALVGPHAEPAVPLLIAKLKSDRVDVRLTALGVLAGIGPGAKQAVPGIRALDGDESLAVQRAVQVAIAVIEGR